ncbi:hypothetical protein NODU109028_06450 [Nocardioides dubius]|uniref:Uncharacterized protein n=1 Tax=Nocardioides dubius TaxID=317019 RepID=A0ABP4E7I8_9ACTN
MAATQPAVKPVKRRKHLMDPNNPVRPRNDKSLTHVQQWVMSSITVTTLAHLAAGVILAALATPASATSARIGLNVIAGAFGVIGVAAGLAIHRRSVLSPWLLLGLLPTAVGLWLAFR